MGVEETRKLSLNKKCTRWKRQRTVPAREEQLQRHKHGEKPDMSGKR